MSYRLLPQVDRYRITFNLRKYGIPYTYYYPKVKRIDGITRRVKTANITEEHILELLKRIKETKLTDSRGYCKIIANRTTHKTLTKVYERFKMMEKLNEMD